MLFNYGLSTKKQNVHITNDSDHKKKAILAKKTKEYILTFYLNSVRKEFKEISAKEIPR